VDYEWWKTDANQSDAGIVYKVTTTTSGSSPKVTYFDAFNRKTKEQHTGLMMREPCTLRFINTNNFANDVFGGGFLMS
jgi:hypothetical protein